jgi:hypothetical protein
MEQKKDTFKTLKKSRKKIYIALMIENSESFLTRHSKRIHHKEKKHRKAINGNDKCKSNLARNNKTFLSDK